MGCIRRPQGPLSHHRCKTITMAKQKKQRKRLRRGKERSELLEVVGMG